MDPSENPYVPGAGTTPPALVGRSALLERMAISLKRILNGSNERSLLLSGLRGVGKTVLLRAFTEQAQTAGAAIVNLEATDDENFMRSLALSLRRVLLAWNGESTLLERAKAILSAFTITIDPTLTVAIGLRADPIVGIADSGLLELDLPDLFSAIGLAAKERGCGILIAVDEVQYIRPNDLKALIVAIHRASQEQLPILFIGAGLPQLYANVGNAKSYAERLFTFEDIGALSSDDVALAIQGPAQKRNVSFTEKALETIYSATSGYPYFVQEWAYDSWNYSEVSPIDQDAVLAVSDMVRRRLDTTFFRVRFDRLTPRERQYLRALAELGAGAHRSGEIASILGTRSTNLGPTRDHLIQKGMIYSPEWGVTGFTVPLFEEFMQREMPFVKFVPRLRRKQ